LTYCTANLQSCILYIYSTNIGTEYFKHGIYCPFFPLQNAVCFIILTYLVPVLFTFYIQVVIKLKKNNSGTKRLILQHSHVHFIFFISYHPLIILIKSKHETSPFHQQYLYQQLFPILEHLWNSKRENVVPQNHTLPSLSLKNKVINFIHTQHNQ